MRFSELTTRLRHRRLQKRRRRICGQWRRGRLAVEAVEDRLLLSATSLTNSGLGGSSVGSDALLDSVAAVVDTDLYQEALSADREIALLAGPNGRQWQWLVNTAVVNHDVQETVYVSTLGGTGRVTVHVLNSIFPLATPAVPAGSLVASWASSVAAATLEPAQEVVLSDTSVDEMTPATPAVQDGQWVDPPIVTLPFEPIVDHPRPLSFPTSNYRPVTPRPAAGDQGEARDGDLDRSVDESSGPRLPRETPANSAGEGTSTSPPATVSSPVPIHDSPFIEPLSPIQFSSLDPLSGEIVVVSAHSDFAVDHEDFSLKSDLPTVGMAAPSSPYVAIGPVANIAEFSFASDRHAADVPVKRVASSAEASPSVALPDGLHRERLPGAVARAGTDRTVASDQPQDRDVKGRSQQGDAKRRELEHSVGRNDLVVEQPIFREQLPADGDVEGVPRESLMPQRLPTMQVDAVADEEGGPISVAELVASAEFAAQVDVLPEDTALITRASTSGTMTREASAVIDGEMARAVAFAVIDDEGEIDVSQAGHAVARDTSTASADESTELPSARNAVGLLPVSQRPLPSGLAQAVAAIVPVQSPEADSRDKALTEMGEVAEAHGSAQASTDLEVSPWLVQEATRRRHGGVLPLLTVLALERFITPSRSRRHAAALPPKSSQSWRLRA